MRNVYENNIRKSTFKTKKNQLYCGSACLQPKYFFFVFAKGLRLDLEFILKILSHEHNCMYLFDCIVSICMKFTIVGLCAFWFYSKGYKSW